MYAEMTLKKAAHVQNQILQYIFMYSIFNP